MLASCSPARRSRERSGCCRRLVQEADDASDHPSCCVTATSNPIATDSPPPAGTSSHQKRITLWSYPALVLDRHWGLVSANRAGTKTSFVTAVDVTAAELSIESFFPVDAATAGLMRRGA